MTRLLALPLLCLPSLALAAPGLSVTGTCPGEMEIAVTDVDGPRFGLVWGTDEGADDAGLWYCGATATGLSGVGGVKYFRASLGAATLTPTISDSVCDMHVQVFDLSSCEGSDVMPMDGSGGTGSVLIAAAGSNGVAGLWSVDTDTGEVTFITDPGIPFTGLAHDDDGNLWGITAGRCDEYYGCEKGIYSIDDDGVATHSIGVGLYGEVTLGWHDGKLYYGDQYDKFGSYDPGTGTLTHLGGMECL